jgi:hypothetical protein
MHDGNGDGTTPTAPIVYIAAAGDDGRMILQPGLAVEEIGMAWITTRRARTTSTAVLGLGALVLCMAEAGAVDPRVQAACTGDFLSYCGQHDPDSPGARQCMRANAGKLSAGCVSALVASGEAGGAKQVARGSMLPAKPRARTPQAEAD